MKIKVAFFHGLESRGKTKAAFLDDHYDVWSPEIDYRSPDFSFDAILQEVKDRNIQVLVGSSMGGWLAYAIATHTGLRTILFNPALHGRSFEPDITLGTTETHNYIVLGNNDEVIDPSKTQEWIRNQKSHSSWAIQHVEMGHRTPLDIFQRIIKGEMMFLSPRL